MVIWPYAGREKGEGVGDGAGRAVEFYSVEAAGFGALRRIHMRIDHPLDVVMAGAGNNLAVAL